jgi:ankyrin repeat protein
MLLEAGAKHSEGNAHKHTPLHLSAQNKFLELTKLLVQAGADMDYQDLIGMYYLFSSISG